jgi:hypothetical protein
MPVAGYVHAMPNGPRSGFNHRPGKTFLRLLFESTQHAAPVYSTVVTDF